MKKSCRPADSPCPGQGGRLKHLHHKPKETKLPISCNLLQQSHLWPPSSSQQVQRQTRLNRLNKVHQPRSPRSKLTPHPTMGKLTSFQSTSSFYSMTMILLEMTMTWTLNSSEGKTRRGEGISGEKCCSFQGQKQSQTKGDFRPWPATTGKINMINTAFQTSLTRV